MRRTFFVAFAVLIAGLALAPAAHAQSASAWNKRGQDAEIREDYDTAYEAYLKANQKNPKDLRYIARVDRMRFQAAAAHVERGRILRQSGDLAAALNQFTRALQIDPGNESASQEIQITQRQDRAPGASLTPNEVTPAISAALRDVSQVSAPIVLKPMSDELVTLHTVEDTRYIYTALGKGAGLNVLFDPDVPPKRIPIDLVNVNLVDALRIVGTVAGTFYKAITQDTIYVAVNTPTKHRDLDSVAVQTFYLTNASSQADANEIQTAIRNVLAPEDKVFLIASQNALVVRAPPEHLMLAQKLLNDLDRTRAEVVVDVAILEVNRDKIRNLGITLPNQFGIQPQTTPNATNTTGASTGTGTAAASSFTLNTLANINATNFAVTIGGGTLNALLTDSDTRVLQNPSIRATDGQTAKLRIGSKIPIATGSFGGGGVGAAGALGGYGVQTQFTYLEVGVNIDMTPAIHLDREVSLKLNVEVSSQTGSVSVSQGVTQPIIGQRSDSTTIQLRDGEPCMLAGILTKTDNTNSSGTPGLSEIPFLKYLFGSVYKENQQDEVVFILVPHIVRESVLTSLNTRSIDTGTASSIEIRHSNAPIDDLFPASVRPAPGSTLSAANAASVMVQQLKQQALPPTPGAPPAATAAAAPGGPPVTLTVLPLNSTHDVGSTFQASILLTGAQDVFSVPLQIQFDPKVLQLVNVDAGGLLQGDGQPVALVHRDEGNGLVTISASRPPGVRGVNGQGEVCTLTFKAIAAGDTNINLVKMGAKNSLQANLPATGTSAAVHVK